MTTSRGDQWTAPAAVAICAVGTTRGAIRGAAVGVNRSRDVAEATSMREAALDHVPPECGLPVEAVDEQKTLVAGVRR
jgi:hypothetical protein